ncbi:MAG: hypothetical protein LBH01_04805 [Verrucomicrobiales bacterium]|jgi:hypothetical protein|nr:hypothetical protein [Verrucomicrobiales bacterium]
MRNITVNDVSSRGNEILVNFTTDIPGVFRDKTFYMAYRQDVSSVPAGIAVIPFLANVLPIVWLTDAELVLDELDHDFYHSIEKLKRSYAEMYPMLHFGGKVTVGRVLEHRTDGRQAGLFFSGGVDATSSLIEGREQKPHLIISWGGDVPMTSVQAWEKVENHVKNIAADFGVPYTVMKTNNKIFVDEGFLGEMVSTSGNKWWFGFQHGIGTIGQAAPYAYLEGINRLYMASSYTAEMRQSCASHPTIDSNIKFCGVSTVHHQYELNRQMKVQNICRYGKVKLRVCWLSSKGDNCCRCEKCYRTIAGLWAENANPADYGLAVPAGFHRKIIRDLTTKIVVAEIAKCFWNEVRQRFIQNQEQVTEKEFLRWIVQTNIDDINNSAYKRFKRSAFYHYQKRFFKKATGILSRALGANGAAMRPR